MTEAVVLDQQTTREDLKLQLSRVIRAERKRVFDAWARPELMAQWFAPGTVNKSVTADLRPGGEYRIDAVGASCDPNADSSQGPSAIQIVGVYQEVVPDERISFTWRGSRFPDEHTLVTVAFKDAPEGTEVTITHEHFSTAEAVQQHQRGWEGCLTSLENFLTK
jgi:uncharacterized protein YndB with AHSA1/START domain